MTALSSVTVPTVPPGRPESDDALVIEGLVKEFVGLRALDGADLRVRRGEIHGLIGHNGSGKSTLVKVLAGYHQRDAGRLQVADTELPNRITAATNHRVGVGFVHQDLGLVGELSIADNLGFSARGFARRRSGLINWAMQRQAVHEALALVGIDLDPRVLVGTLPPVEQSLVAIARACAELDAAKLLVLDEPTARLPKEDVGRLLAVVRSVAASGTGVLFISHRLDEVLHVCSAVTVFREGRDVENLDPRTQTHHSLVAAMLGLDPDEEQRVLGRTETRQPGTSRISDGPAALVLRDVSGGEVRQASLQVASGEVLALTGSLGSGVEDLAKAAYGLIELTSGSVAIDGEEMTRPTPGRCRELGTAFISSNRLGEAGLGTLDLTMNVHAHGTGRLPRPWPVASSSLRRSTAAALQDFDVRPKDPSARFDSLSGGNQQKVLIAKWLRLSPKLLVLVEPTQGVDPGSRHEIYSLVRAASASGLAVVWVTTDLEEVPLVADRVLVMYEGSVVADAAVTSIQSERLLQLVLTGREA